MNGKGNIFAKYQTINLCARALGQDIENKNELNTLWHKYNKARIENDIKKVNELSIQLENSITTNYRYVLEFQKEYSKVNTEDDSKKDMFRVWSIGVLSSDMED